MDMTEVKKFDLQVSTLKLSKAIRIGAKLRPQGREVLFAYGKTCAIGAAMEARGWVPSSTCENDGLRLYASDLIGPNEAPNKLFAEIGRRNDCGESRESIADWLESQGY